MKKFYSLLIVLFAISSVAVAQNSENEKYSDIPRSRSRRTDISVSPFMGSYMAYANNNHGALLDVRYKINPYVALGAGVGAFILDIEELEADKAIYTSARVNLSENTETVFLDFKMGTLATYGSVGFLWGHLLDMILEKSISHINISTTIGKEVEEQFQSDSIFNHIMFLYSRNIIVMKNNTTELLQV